MRTLLGLVLCMTCGCVGTRTGNPGNNDSPTGIVIAQSQLDRDRAPEVSAVDATTFGTERQAFALEMYRQLASRPGNQFLSPHSISIGLAMAFAGAKGQTETEMANVLHFGLAQPVLHAAFNATDLELSKRQDEFPSPVGVSGDAFELSLFNHAWGQTGYTFLDSYLDTLATNYGAGLFLIDFAQSNAARQLVNQWVSDETKDRVADLLPDGATDRDTVLVLTNTIYFKASWKRAFDATKTEQGTFVALAGARDVPMMHTTQQLDYAAVDDFRAVSLPYLSENVRMVLVLPPAGPFEDAVNKLTATLVGRLLSEVNTPLVTLTLPKWSFAQDYPLKAPLRALGMHDAFAAGAANFSGMGGQPGAIWIDEIYHKTFISVDERGTEAAAASGVVVGRGIPPESVTISFDRPFMFLVYDAPTKQILFIGHLVDPA